MKHLFPGKTGLMSFTFFAVALMVQPLTLRAQADAKDEKAKENTGAIKTFESFFKGPVKTEKGLFTIHEEKDVFYFEIPDSLLGKDMLVVSRRVAMSSSEIDNMVAGESAQSGGLMVQWDKTPDGKTILLRKVTTRNQMRFTGQDTAFRHSLALQTLDPILLAFPVKATGKSGNSSIIDIKPLYLADIKELTPFSSNPFLLALGIAGKKYKYEADRSFMNSVQSFQKNIEVRSTLTFTEGNNTYTILMNRSMVLLPDLPMQPRFADDRVGYFTTSYTEFNESEPVKPRSIISRWKLEPRAGDEKKIEQGQLVEPLKPIVFYIDKATPAKWIPYIKQGVEDWRPAFEAAGFKNAIIAAEAPVNDPEYNPEDVRYSVIRYTASNIPNAKGPSVTDPRSGEILDADIIIYHNIFQLLRDWRFAQTAASDPRVRTTDIPDSILGEAFRYVVAHEVGHALGLRHNMAASFAFPVDSLRSATFTQKHGTTPSIMDYARFNYVAQPRDKGVKLTPPLLGPYDKYAIAWGYKPIPVDSPLAEVPVLNKWIEKHLDDPSYRFGEGDVNSSDPVSLRESLGDDLIKASEYGVKNIKYTLAHLDEWLGKKGESYDELETHYTAVLKQYERYIDHVATNIAGVYQRYPVQGEGVLRYRYVEKDVQRKSVAFVLKQYRELPQWLGKDNPALTIIENSGGVRRLMPVSSYIERLLTRSFQGDLLNNGKLAYLVDNAVANGKAAYSAKDLLSDIRTEVFRETVAGKTPGFYGEMLQSIYVDRLINISKLGKNYGTPKAFAAEAGQALANACFGDYEAFEAQRQNLASTDATGSNNLYFQYMDFKASDKMFKIESLVLGELKDIRKLILQYTKAKNPAPDHYAFLLKRIDGFLAVR